MRPDADMGELEREFELELEGEEGTGQGSAEAELEAEFDRVAEREIEGESAFGRAAFDGEADGLAERFHELESQQFESELELDNRLNELLYEAEREFFFKGAWRKLRRAGKGLLKRGLRLAGNLPAFQAFRGVTQLARGNLRGMLGALAKGALASGVVPGGAMALPALKALGFEAEAPEDRRAAWSNYALVAREAYDHLARNLSETADHPAEAARLASEALQAGLARARNGGARLPSSGGGVRTRTIRVSPGETIVLQVR